MLSHTASSDTRQKRRTKSAAIEKRNGDKKQPVFPSDEFTITDCAGDNVANTFSLLK